MAAFGAPFTRYVLDIQHVSEGINLSFPYHVVMLLSGTAPFSATRHSRASGKNLGNGMT